jgi:hypothetical protein
MRVIKLYTFLAILAVALVSCEKATDENVVFYSKDDLKKELSVNINDTDGSLVSINSATVLSLFSSDFFKKNIAYLRDVSVPKMYFKVKNLNANSSNSISNVEVFIDEIRITNDMGTDFLNATNNNVQYEIDNQELLTAIASKLMQKRQVTISYYSDAVTVNPMDFGFEFSITAQGTFVD